MFLLINHFVIRLYFVAAGRPAGSGLHPGRTSIGVAVEKDESRQEVAVQVSTVYLFSRSRLLPPLRDGRQFDVDARKKNVRIDGITITITTTTF